MAFSPPTLPLSPDSPYLPAQNVVNSVAVSQGVGGITIWSYSGNGFSGFVALLGRHSNAYVMVKASANNSWLRFFDATLTLADRANPQTVNVAENWWQQNVYQPAFAPLLPAF
jgi:hypothetical protein